MNKTISIRSAAIIAGFSAVTVFALTLTFAFQIFNDDVSELRKYEKRHELLTAVENCIEEYYYQDPDEKALINSAVKGLTAGLDDKYSKYMTEEEFEEAIQDSKGNIVGIGITVNEDDTGYLKIVNISADSPAEQQNLKINDLIIAVNGKNVTEMEYMDTVRLIRGDAGTKVTLTIRRDNKDSDYTLERKNMQEITANGKMINNNIGYIKLTGFKETTYTQYKKLLDDLLENGAKGIIFDVRNNGGGLVYSVSECLDPLLPEGDVATAIFRDGSSETICSSDANELNIPMVVLVNEHTASAAELFASALRDFDKGVLVGVNTFGKGIMQDTFPIDGGGGLTLTVAKYKTAKSECYHGIGLAPDYEITLPNDTDISEIDTEKDLQLKKAIEILFK